MSFTRTLPKTFCTTYMALAGTRFTVQRTQVHIWLDTHILIGLVILMIASLHLPTVFTFSYGPICWQIKKQHVVVLSSTEAQKPSVIYCDNQSTIQISKKPIHHQSTKHIEIPCIFSGSWFKSRSSICTIVLQQSKLQTSSPNPSLRESMSLFSLSWGWRTFLLGGSLSPSCFILSWGGVFSRWVFSFPFCLRGSFVHGYLIMPYSRDPSLFTFPPKLHLKGVLVWIGFFNYLVIS